MATDCHSPVRRCISKTPSGNPLPRRGQVKENIGRYIVAALACDKAGGKKGGGKLLDAAAAAADAAAAAAAAKKK